jgi:hypothetical protein
MMINIDYLDSEYCFPPMDLKVSKLINDSKWKSGQTTFVMQLKIKYFVNDIVILRFDYSKIIKIIFHVLFF